MGYRLARNARRDAAAAPTTTTPTREAAPRPSTPATIEVLLVDDQRAVLSGVAALIDGESPRMRVAGQASRGQDALDLACAVRPHVVVLDADLDGEDGLDLIPRLRLCGSAIVVLTALAEPQLRLRALRLGAAAFVSKAAPGEDLLAAIDGAIA